MGSSVSRIFDEVETRVKAVFKGDIGRATSIEHAKDAIIGNTMPEQTQQTPAPKPEPIVKPIPEPPKIETGKAEVKAISQATTRRRAIGRNKTIFTSALGLTGNAPTIKKTLLGE